MRNITLTIALAILAIDATAQTKDAQKYRKESEEIRKQVWAWEKPQFKVREIPQQYASASKVVIAHHTELTADSKSKVAYYGLGFGVNKQQSITEIVREVVKLNDKNAVEEYSEFSFTQFARASGFFSSNKQTTFIGVRVVKSNGATKEINADDIVLTNDASKAKTAKVAIPDLEIGDVLDYFFATEQSLTNATSAKAYRVLLFADAPILSLSFHAQLGKKFAIDYRSYNGAPELKVEKNSDKEIIVDVEKTNIPPFETALWVAPARQLPFIRMNISLGYRGPGRKALDMSKPGEVTKMTTNEEALDEKATQYSGWYYDQYWMSTGRRAFYDIESQAKSLAKSKGINYKSLSEDEKAAHLFYTLRFIGPLSFDINSLAEKINIGQNEYDGYPFPLFALFKASGLEPAILVSEARAGFRMKEAMSGNDLAAIAYLSKSRKLFAVTSIFSAPFDVPALIEGAKDAKSFTFDHPGAVMSLKKMMGLTNIGPGFDVPVSGSDKNVRREDLRIALSADKSALTVNRTTVLKGYLKEDEQRRLILYEDYYESERKELGEEKSLIERLEDDKKGKKYVEEVKNAFAEARKKQKDAFLAEAKGWFEQEITDMKNQKINNLGVRHTHPDFSYSSTFTMGGLVKKAGNNIIVEVGKLQGTPLFMKDDQRKRDIDIYMPFARSFEYMIEMEIPEGYTVDGVSALNVKVENETGIFATAATFDGKKLSIMVKKHYAHNFEKAANFDKLMAFMDASNTWTNAKILLKKS